MRRPVDEQSILRWGVGLNGLLLLIAASFAADMAAQHMRALGVICGGSAPHCGWCYAAAAFALSGVAALAGALLPTARKVAIRAQ